jgi:hypothetical protein
LRISARLRSDKLARLTLRVDAHTDARRRRRRRSRVIEINHAMEIEAWLTFQLNACTDARRRRMRFNVDRVLVHNPPPAAEEAEKEEEEENEEEEIQRWVGRVLDFDKPLPGH